MPAPAEILDLIARFEQHLDAYKSGQYNETQLRRDYLDPFFKALGWDIDNTAGHAEAYRDVIHEDAIRIGGVLKAPDYSFRIGSTRKFFLEAKKPSVHIKEEIPPAHQVRLYAWNAKLPLSILSDFEEFAIYDGRVKPHRDDKASVARIFYCTFRDYAEKWDHLASIFSKDAVLRGAYDKFAEANKAKRGTTEVDADFLATIEGWRKELAQNLALRNEKLSQRELNFAVQRIIDRIIFLRICEDRGIEDYGRLQALVNGDRIYPRLAKLFEDADARYNSGLFHFHREPGRHEAPDEFTLGLAVDDRLLRDILKNLYYPDSPYLFSIISADILGQVYEQFLGKIIRLTEGHRAVIDDKPEVKKAGGVYYTPTYIVDYIVRQTVGKLIEEAGGGGVSSPSPLGGERVGVRGENVAEPATALSVTPAPPHPGPLPLRGGEGEGRRATAILSRVAKLRVLDPACGSGSFLIGAYQHLLDWHLQFYTAHDPAKWAKGRKPALVQTTKGWRLTIAERKRILLDNIYGVDIDAQAVEVTKLSLLLKVLEGETHQSLEPMFRLFHERALPDLGNNIKCGNSLIGPDFYQQSELPLLTDEEKYRINVFDWHAEFPGIFGRKTTTGEDSTGELRETASPLDYTAPGVPLHGSYSYKKKKGEKAVSIPLPVEPEWEGGFDAVIGNPPYVRIQGFPRNEIDYLTQRYRSANGNCDLYVSFIERGFTLLSQQGRLGLIVPNKFFKTDYGRGLRGLLSRRKAVSDIVDFGAEQVFAATTYTCLLFLSKRANGNFRYAQAKANPDALKALSFVEKGADSVGEAPWSFAGVEMESLLSKLSCHSIRLLDLPAEMSRGSSTGADEVFVFPHGSLSVEEGILREPLFATDFGRYRYVPPDKWRVIFPYVLESDGYRLYSEREMKAQFPKAFAYLQSHQATLRKRKQFKEWYGYSAPRNLELHGRAQIMVPLLANKGLFALIPEATRGHVFVMASAGFSVTVSSECRMKPEYVLGLLNSRLLFWKLEQSSNVFRGGWITCTKQYFGELPIRVIPTTRIVWYK